MKMELNPAERLGQSQEDLAKAQQEHSESLDQVDRWVDSGELTKIFGEAKAKLIRERTSMVINYFDLIRKIKKLEKYLSTTIDLPPATTKMAAGIDKLKTEAEKIKDEFEKIKPVEGEKVEPLSSWPDYEDVIDATGYTSENRDILSNNDIRAVAQKDGKWFVLDSGFNPVEVNNFNLTGKKPHKDSPYNFPSFEWKDKKSGEVVEITLVGMS